MTAHLQSLLDMAPKGLFPHFDKITPTGAEKTFKQGSTGETHQFIGEGDCPKIEEIAQGNMWRGICLGFTPIIAFTAMIGQGGRSLLKAVKTAQEVYSAYKTQEPTDGASIQGPIEFLNAHASKFDAAWHCASLTAKIGLIYFAAEATRDPISACIPGFHFGIAAAATFYGLRNPLKFWDLAGRFENWCGGTGVVTEKLFSGRMVQVKQRTE